MTDAILVLNAGSSSIKFSVFDPRARLDPSLRGQVEGLYTAPRFTAKDATGSRIGARLGRGRAARPRRRYPPPRRLPARAPRRPPARRGRPPRGAWRPSIRAGAGRRPRCSRAREADPAGAAAPAAQPRRHRDRRELQPDLPQVACFDTAFHRAQPERGAGLRAPARDHRPRRSPLRLPRAVLRVHRERAAGDSTPKAAAGRVVVAHLAMARACARCAAGAASRARWASPRWTACRWARAAARSIPA